VNEERGKAGDEENAAKHLQSGTKMEGIASMCKVGRQLGTVLHKRDVAAICHLPAGNLCITDITCPILPPTLE
jgi:hypothetical protein